MEETILEIYETYFKNDNWCFSIDELASHNCLFCNNEKFKITCDYKQEMVELIILYLNHLKIYGCIWKKVNYFISSIKLSDFCNNNKTSTWVMEYRYEKDIYILRSI